MTQTNTQYPNRDYDTPDQEVEAELEVLSDCELESLIHFFGYVVDTVQHFSVGSFGEMIVRDISFNVIDVRKVNPCTFPFKYPVSRWATEKDAITDAVEIVRKEQTPAAILRYIREVA